MTSEQLGFDLDPVNEEWRDIPGYEGQYQVSSLGRVRGLDRFANDGRRVRGAIKNARLDHDGYPRVSLGTGKRGRKKTVHVDELVMLAFVGSKPAGMVVRHLDDVKSNSRLSNLCYGTRLENIEDANKNGKLANRRGGCGGPIISPELVGVIRSAASAQEAVRLTGVSARHCRDIRANRIACWRI